MKNYMLWEISGLEMEKTWLSELSIYKKGEL